MRQRLEMVNSLIELEEADLLQPFSMAPFTEVNKLNNILHVLATKMHFVFSSMTCFHPCGIKDYDHFSFKFMILRAIFFRELTCQNRCFFRRLFLGCVKFVRKGYSSTLKPRGVTKALGLKILLKLRMSSYKVTPTVANWKT